MSDSDRIGLGFGSGIDLQSTVNTLMHVQRKPILRLDAQKREATIQIDNFSKIKAQLSTFQESVDKLKDSRFFNSRTTKLSNTDIFAVVANSSATVGKYEISVSTLAEKHTLASKVYTDRSTVVGEGQLTITSGSDSIVITINSENNTLTGIRDAINSAENNKLVNASIINVDGGSRLILNANKTGKANALEITVTDDSDNDDKNTDGLSALVYQSVDSDVKNMIETQAATDAKLKVNGFNVSRSSNTFNDVIDGLQFTLKAVGDVDISVKRDTSTVKAEIKKLVDFYNATMNMMESQSREPKFDKSFMVRLKSSIRSTFGQHFSSFGDDIQHIAELGISLDKNGSLNLDSSKLNSVIDADIERVQAFFTGVNAGFATKLHSVLNNFTGPNGIIKLRAESLASQINWINDRIMVVDERLKLVEKNLRAKFGALDALITEMQATSKELDKQLKPL